MADPVQTSGESEAFNTPLPEDKAQEYQAWKAKYAPNDDGSDYDLQGAFLAGVKPDPERGHFPDTFKKPNHPTFSDQSIWNGRPDGNGGVYQGGKWGEGDSFTEGPTNKKFHSDEDEQNYFKKYEPNSALNQGAPASVPIDSSAPPKWDDIQKTEAYRNLSPEAGQLVFRNWVKDTQGYL